MSDQSDLDDSNDNFESQFKDLYKNTGKTMEISQDERRQMFLQYQKEKRATTFDEKRDLIELFNDDGAERMEYDENAAVKAHKKRRLPFEWKMMGSELLTEIPDDFGENWLIKPCPEGVRYLVVANKGFTTCYMRNGRSCFKFSSNLPGGNRELPHKFTVLDCIFNKDVNTYFVFDVLAWNSMSLLNVDAHHRFYWLKSKFDENSDLFKIESSKQLEFHLVNPLATDLTLIQDLFFSPFIVNNVNLPYEGMLFYHKEGYYKFGHTPLVGWLKSFMIPEVLHIDVDVFHLKNKPDNYENINQYTNRKSRRPKRKKRATAMEIEHSPTN